ncbi:MAG: histone deacetylase family protein, partial [Bacteroidales bacterium]
MFRIRKVPDDLYAMNRHAVDQVKQILKARFSSLSEEKIEAVSEQLHDPLKFRFRSLLFVAESHSARVKGFALLMHAPDHGFCFLDYIATPREDVSSGIGGALYMRCREEAKLLNVSGIYMEALPDDPVLCPGQEMQAQNRARLRFWERFGVRPIINTLYETPVKPGDTCPPYLLLDNLDRGPLPSRRQARDVVEAILQRKYGDYCPQEYISRVTASFNDDPVMLRPFRYKKEAVAMHPVARPESRQIILVYNQSHSIHHIRERGYVESPVRIRNVLKSLNTSALFRNVDPVAFPEKHIREVHTAGMISFLKQVSAATPAGTLVYPYIFPVRNPQRRPKELPLLAGYYCMDTFTPIHHHLWEVARDAADCALTCASYLVEGFPVAYALVRPPGHHAESNIYGGFCYLNSAAIAANYLSKYGKVAILDVDYHHGNGQQEIFYRRADVLTVSLHGSPANTYPYFCGYRDEKGEAEGLGTNYNFPVKEQASPEDYRQVLAEALKVIKKFDPAFLVISFGLDLAKGDPTGTFSFQSKDFGKNGLMIGALKKPVLVVQEGGYNTSSLGINALRFM